MTRGKREKESSSNVVANRRTDGIDGTDGAPNQQARSDPDPDRGFPLALAEVVGLTPGFGDWDTMAPMLRAVWRWEQVVIAEERQKCTRAVAEKDEEIRSWELADAIRKTLTVEVELMNYILSRVPVCGWRPEATSSPSPSLSCNLPQGHTGDHEHVDRNESEMVVRARWSTRTITVTSLDDVLDRAGETHPDERPIRGSL